MAHFWNYTGPFMTVITLAIGDLRIGLMLLGFETYSLCRHHQVHHPESWLAQWYVKWFGIVVCVGAVEMIRRQFAPGWMIWNLL